MAKFVLTASKSTTAADATKLKFLATMSVAQFIESGYAEKGSLDVIENPKGNAHPANLFISWKDKEGTPYSGAVSNNIKSVEEITDPVLSIVSTPDNADMFVLLHNKHDAPADNTKLALG